MAEVLILGQSPGRGKAGLEAWIHTPSGRRLARMLELRDQRGFPMPERLTEIAELDNLVLREVPAGGLRGVPMPERRVGAARVLASHDCPTIVLAGRSLAKALGCRHRPAVLSKHWCDQVGRQLAVMPHPSGANRYWNDAEDAEAAATWLRRVVGVAP